MEEGGGWQKVVCLPVFLYAGEDATPPEVSALAKSALILARMALVSEPPLDAADLMMDLMVALGTPLAMATLTIETSSARAPESLPCPLLVLALVLGWPVLGSPELGELELGELELGELEVEPGCSVVAVSAPGPGDVGAFSGAGESGVSG